MDVNLEPNIKLYEEISPIERLALQSLSYSRLNAFDWCQAQYFYNYILKYPQEFSPKALLGNVIHKALELTLRDGEAVNSSELFDNFRAAREEYDPDETIISDELIEEGLSMLEDFLKQQGPAKYKLTHAELEFNFVFKGCLFRGFIDQVIVKEDEVVIIDFKSGSWEVPDKEVPSNLQLGIYALYLKYLYPDKKITAGLRYLRSGKTKKHTFTDDDLLAVEDRLTDAIEGLKNHNNYLPVNKNLSWKCTMCSYQKDGTCKAGVFNVEQREKKKNKLIGDYNLYS